MPEAIRQFRHAASPLTHALQTISPWQIILTYSARRNKNAFISQTLLLNNFSLFNQILMKLKGMKTYFL